MLARNLVARIAKIIRIVAAGRNFCNTRESHVYSDVFAGKTILGWQVGKRTQRICECHGTKAEPRRLR